MERWRYEEALDNWRASLRDSASRWTRRIFPRLAIASLEIDATGLISSAIPQLFSMNLLQIHPSLNADLLELYGKSGQILGNRFTFLNVSKKFVQEIDWECPANPFWRNELHAFDFGLDLALTFRISGEEKYARHLRYLISHWISRNAPLEGSAWGLPALARRVRNWILASDLARASLESDPEFFPLFKSSLALQCLFLLRQAGVRLGGQFAPQAARGLLLAGRFFGGSGGAELRAKSLELILRMVGSHDEADVAAACSSPGAALRLAATLVEWLLFDDENQRRTLLKEKLSKILETLGAILLPDGNLPLFGFPAAEELADVSALSAVLLREPRWKSMAGKFGILPYMLLGEEGKNCFDQLPELPREADRDISSGSGIFRLTGADSSALAVSGQRPCSSTGHADSLSFELMIRGHRVIVDSGAYAPEGDPHDTYFPSAVAHNLLLVDHRASRASVAKDACNPSEKWESESDITGLHLSSTGFLQLGLDHVRSWFCLKGSCWVILDRLDGQGLHTCTSLLHFYPTYEVEILENRAVARSRALEIAVVPFGSTGARLTVSRGDHTEFPGWYASGLGIKYPSSVLALTWLDIRPPWLCGQIIIPGAGGHARATVADADAETVCVEISGTQYRLPTR